MNTTSLSRAAAKALSVWAAPAAQRAAVASGRLASSDPNLQNIPIRTEEGRAIRGAFVPEPGWVLLDADYSQIELRVVAALAEDPVLLGAFAAGEDIHRRTSSEVMGKPMDQVTADDRSRAKAVNFGLLYGQGPFALVSSVRSGLTGECRSSVHCANGPVAAVRTTNWGSR